MHVYNAIESMYWQIHVVARVMQGGFQVSPVEVYAAQGTACNLKAEGRGQALARKEFTQSWYLHIYGVMSRQIKTWSWAHALALTAHIIILHTCTL